MRLDEQESSSQQTENVFAAQEVNGQLEAVFDAMVDCVFVYNEHGQLIKSNSAGRELLGYEDIARALSASPHEGTDRFSLRDIHGQQLTEADWPVSRLLRGEEFKGTNALEVLAHALDSTDRFLSLSGTTIRDADSRIIGGVIVVRDVTERHMQEDRRMNEERYRTIVQTANEGIWLFDTHGHTIYTNERMATMLGYSTEDLQQRTIVNCVFPEDIPAARMRVNSNLVGQHEQFEFYFRRRDGSPLPTLASSSPMYDADGTIIGGLCLFTDITARRRVEEALRQSEELLRVALRNAPIAVFRQDLDLRYTWMYNPPTTTPELIIGKTDADFVPPDVARHLKKIKSHVLVTGESVHEEIRTPNIHGTRFELLNLEPLRDGNGVIIGLLGTAINITERKLLEQRTRRALEALLAMAEAMVRRSEPASEPLDHAKSELQIVAQQIALLARDVLGCERLSLHQLEPGTECMVPLATVGLSSTMEAMWWEQQEQNTVPFSVRFGEDMATHLRQQEVLIVDMTQPTYRKHPNPYGIHNTLIAPLSLNGQLLGLLVLDYSGAAHEYTAEEIALTQTTCRLISLVIERQQLLASNQRLNELIEQAYDAVIVRDPESCVEFWNKGAEHLYGWTKEEAMGQSTHTLLATRFPVARESIENSLAEHGQWEGILQHSRRDGTSLTVESRQVLIRDAAGRSSSILEINRDITERERLTRERAEAQANARVLREANQLMDEFIGIAGHELRTPLTSVKASVQLAKRQLNRVLKQDMPLADAQSQLTLVYSHLERTERQIGMQNRLISDLLDVSRIHSGRLELHPDLCDLIALTREVVEDQRFLTPERTIVLTDTAHGELLVLADADRVRQVISNYLSNALKYSEVTKPVALNIEVVGKQVRVSVYDQGPGLSEDQQKYVWERFYRVPGIEVKTGSGVGLGLGLHISRMIIERQRGQIGVESKPGEGSTFWFTLPLAESV